MPNEQPKSKTPQNAPAGKAAEGLAPAGGIGEGVAPNIAAESADARPVAEKPDPAPSTRRGETMEIHTPDKPIHSKKEFMFHMFTVILGILIALGLEGIVEWAHHRALVREARANIATELRHNKETVDKALPQIRQREQLLMTIIKAMEEVQKSHQLKQSSLLFNFSTYELYSTAWKTASVSGAVTYMDYEELKKYTDVYDEQQDFVNVQNQAFPVVGSLSATMQVLNRDIAKVSAAQLDEIQTEAIKMLTIEQALEGVASSLSKQYENAAK
jgi:hypothetical protein